MLRAKGLQNILRRDTQWFLFLVFFAVLLIIRRAFPMQKKSSTDSLYLE